MSDPTTKHERREWRKLPDGVDRSRVHRLTNQVDTLEAELAQVREQLATARAALAAGEEAWDHWNNCAECEIYGGDRWCKEGSRLLHAASWQQSRALAAIAGKPTKKPWPGHCQSCQAPLDPPNRTDCPTCGASDFEN